MQYCMIRLEQCTNRFFEFVATVTWLDEDQIHVRLVTWRDYFFCLCVKEFISSTFSFVNFWSSKFGIVVDTELADINLSSELRVFLMKTFMDFHFGFQEKSNPQAFWCTRNLPRKSAEEWTSDNCKLSNLPSIDLKGEFFEERTKLCKNLRSFLKKVGNWYKTIALLKFKVLVMLGRERKM